MSGDADRFSEFIVRLAKDDDPRELLEIVNKMNELNIRLATQLEQGRAIIGDLWPLVDELLAQPIGSSPWAPATKARQVKAGQNRERARGFRARGWTIAKIAKTLEVTERTVSTYLNKDEG